MQGTPFIRSSSWWRRACSRPRIPRTRRSPRSSGRLTQAACAEETVPLLAEFLSAGRSGLPPLAMIPELQRRKTFAALAAWMLRPRRDPAAGVRPGGSTLGDPSTLELFGLLGEQSSTARVLMVSPRDRYSNLRGQRGPTLSGPARAAHETAGARHGGAPGRAAGPRGGGRTLAQQADGVPLFVEELTCEWSNRGASRYVEGVIPATLQDSLMARLDRLSRRKKSRSARR